MGSSVDILQIFVMWNSFCMKNGYSNHIPQELLNFLEVICRQNQAAFFISIFFRWYLQRLKPQEIRPNSKITPSNPLLRSRLYPLFHLIPPKVPSAWMLRFILRSAPWTQFRLFSTSLWSFVSSSLMRTIRFSLLLWHFSL